MVLLSAGAVQAATPAEIRSANGGSLVYLEFEGTNATGVPITTEATGFLVSTDGLVLTARHSVEDAQGRPLFDRDEYTIRGAIGSQEQNLRRLQVVGKSQADVMLLRFRGARTDYKPVALCAGVTAEVGDRLVTLGFPRNQDLSIIDGLLSSKAQNESQTSVPFTYGYSGGPVFAEDDGQLLGLVEGGIAQTESISFFTPIHRATSLLQDGGIMLEPCAAMTPILAGSVADAITGQPIAGAEVRIRYSGKVVGSGITDTEGRYRVAFTVPSLEAAVTMIVSVVSLNHALAESVFQVENGAPTESRHPTIALTAADSSLLVLIAGVALGSILIIAVGAWLLRPKSTTATNGSIAVGGSVKGSTLTAGKPVRSAGDSERYEQ